MRWTIKWIFLFLLFAVIAVVCAINVVLQKHPISSALSLVGVMGSLAVLYLLLGAEFIAMAQIIVYAGAVMVLFIFVIMLLNAGAEERRGRSWTARLLGVPAVARACSALLAYFSQRGFRTAGRQIRRFHGRRRRSGSARRCSPITCCRSKSLPFSS